MACACKSKSAGQVTAVKQVVKRASTSSPKQAQSKPSVKRATVRHIIYKRPL